MFRGVCLCHRALACPARAYIDVYNTELAGDLPTAILERFSASLLTKVRHPSATATHRYVLVRPSRYLHACETDPLCGALAEVDWTLIRAVPSRSPHTQGDQPNLAEATVHGYRKKVD